MTRLRAALAQRVLVLDGAMGTMLQAAGLGAADFGGPALEGCNEHLNLTRPDVVRPSLTPEASSSPTAPNPSTTPSSGPSATPSTQPTPTASPS